MASSSALRRQQIKVGNHATVATMSSLLVASGDAFVAIDIAYRPAQSGNGVTEKSARRRAKTRPRDPARHLRRTKEQKGLLYDIDGDLAGRLNFLSSGVHPISLEQSLFLGAAQTGPTERVKKATRENHTYPDSAQKRNPFSVLSILRLAYMAFMKVAPHEKSQQDCAKGTSHYAPSTSHLAAFHFPFDLRYLRRTTDFPLRP